MRRSSRTTRTLAVAAVAAAALAIPQGASAGGLFDFFGLLGASQRYTPATAYAEPTAPADKPLDLQSAPSFAQGSTTYCVRLCDGRYFPLSAPAVDSRAGAAKTCSALCPAAKTVIFRGDDIDHAAGTRGERYADLDQAFVYRDHLVSGCTCNGRDAFGLAPIDVASDPTLRPGDMVATSGGLSLFKGTRAASNAATFTPIRRDTASADVRRMLVATQTSRQD